MKTHLKGFISLDYDPLHLKYENCAVGFISEFVSESINLMIENAHL